MSDQDNIPGSGAGEPAPNQLTDQTTTPTGPEGTSRRNFLRAALVGSAAVVAVGAGADAVLSRTGGVSTIPFIGTVGSPPPPPSITASLEESALDGCHTTYAGTGQWFPIFTIRNLPAGNYSVDLTQQVNGGSTGIIQPKGTGSSTLPWQYSSNGNNIHVDILDAGDAVDCPTPGKAPGTGSDTLAVAFSVSDLSDVQIYIHIVWGASTNPFSGEISKFTGTLKDTDTNTTVGSYTLSVPAA
jgi:hypothetical protein